MTYRILAIDEDRKALLTIKYYIDMIGVDKVYFEAKTGEEALEIFKKEAPQIVITELNLPDMTGQDLVLEMRSINPVFKLIIQTPDADSIYNIFIQRTLRCIDFLSKPLEQTIFNDAFNFSCNEIPAPEEEKIIVKKGKSVTIIRVNELLGGKVERTKLLLYVYKREINELRTILLDDIKLMHFMWVASRYTDAIVQCQKSYFVNKNLIHKLSKEPDELIMEIEDVRFPVGGNFLPNIIALNSKK